VYMYRLDFRFHFSIFVIFSPPSMVLTDSLL
jgi:hypothetical protein